MRRPERTFSIRSPQRRRLRSNKPALCAAAVACLLSQSVAVAQQKMDDMKGMDMGKKPAPMAKATHVAVGTVTKVDAKAGTVTVARASSRR